MSAPTRRPSAGASPAGYRMRGSQGRVLKVLGEAIVAGEIAPGQLLPREPEIMERFAVSRTTVREAVKVLEAKGLVETRQRVGTRVLSRDRWNVFDADVLALHMARGVDDRLLQDLLEVRALIEPASARFAAARASMADLSAIADALARMAAGLADPAAYAVADVEFHLAVFAASHNTFLGRFAHLVADFLRLSFAIQQRSLNRQDNRIEDDLAAHRLILDAVNRGDPAAAEAAMTEVILNGKMSLLRALGGARMAGLSSRPATRPARRGGAG